MVQVGTHVAFLTSEALLKNIGDLLRITEVHHWITGVPLTLELVLVGLQFKTLASYHLRTLEPDQTAMDQATVEMAASVSEVLQNI